MKNIIALCGKKRSGKDTVGNYIVENYNYKRYAFADSIKEVAKYLFQWNDDYLENHKEKIDSMYGISPRQFFVYFGTNVMQLGMMEQFPLYKEKVGRLFWTKRLIEQIKTDNCENVLITDLRFWHEYKNLKEEFENLKVIRIEREVEREYDKHDLTEKDIEEMNYDYLIENHIEMSLEGLLDKVDNLMKIIS